MLISDIKLRVQTESCIKFHLDENIPQGRPMCSGSGVVTSKYRNTHRLTIKTAVSVSDVQDELHYFGLFSAFTQPKCKYLQLV